MPERKRTAQQPNPPAAIQASGEETSNEPNVCPACDRGPDPIPILRELSETELKRMEEFLHIVLAHRGDCTPAEKFILDLVRYHATYPITPADALDMWKDFRENFGYAIREARHIVKQYPNEFPTVTAAA